MRRKRMDQDQEPNDAGDDDCHCPPELIDLFIELDQAGLDPHTWEPK